MGLDLSDKYNAAARGATYRAAGGITAAAEEQFWARARVVDGHALDFPAYDRARNVLPSNDWCMYVGNIFSMIGMQIDKDGFIQNIAAHIDNMQLLATARGRAFAALWSAAQSDWVTLRDVAVRIETRTRKRHRAFRVRVRRGGREFWLCGALDIVFLLDGLGVLVRAPDVPRPIYYMPTRPLEHDVAYFADAYTAAVMWGAALQRKDGMQLLLTTLHLAESPVGRAMHRLEQSDECHFGESVRLTWDALHAGPDTFPLDGSFGQPLIACWVLLAGYAAVRAAFSRVEDPSFMAWALYRHDALLPELQHVRGPVVMDPRPPEPTFVVDRWGRALALTSALQRDRAARGTTFRARTCAEPPPPGLGAVWTQDLLTRDGSWVEIPATGASAGVSELVAAAGRRDFGGATVVTSEAPPEAPLYRWMPPPLYAALCAAAPVLDRLRTACVHELGAGWTALHFGTHHLDRFYLARLDATTGLVDMWLIEDLGALLEILGEGSVPAPPLPGRRIPVGQMYGDPWLLLRHLSGRGCRDFAQLLNMPGMPPALRDMAVRLPAQWRARAARGPLAGRAVVLRVNGATIADAGPISIEGGRRVVRFAPIAEAATRVALEVQGLDTGPGGALLHAGRPVLAGPLDAVPWRWDGAAGELEWRGGTAEAQTDFIANGADLETRGPTVTPDGRFCVGGGPQGLVYFDDCAVIARLLHDGTPERGHQWVDGRRARAVFASAQGPPPALTI